MQNFQGNFLHKLKHKGRSLAENLCIFGVTLIWAGAEPEGYNLSYSISLNLFFFKLRKKRCSEASSCKAGSSLSFSNLEVSEIISWIALSNVFDLRWQLHFLYWVYNDIFPCFLSDYGDYVSANVQNNDQAEKNLEKKTNVSVHSRVKSV